MSQAKPRVSEAEVARAVVTELQRLGFDTYEEVSSCYCGKRADIVAVQGKWAFIVEVKTAFSLRLLEQARMWSGLPVLLAVPSCRYGWICKQLGFGLWEVCREGQIREVVAPPRVCNRRTFEMVSGWLDESQRSGQYARAGEAGGGYWTPFQQTKRALQSLVKEKPGMTLKEAVDALDHHYASAATARACLPRLIMRGIIEGIELDDKRPMHLWPVEE